MSKKPNFIVNKQERLMDAQQQLENEKDKSDFKSVKSTVQTTLILETEIHHAIQEIGLKRKKLGIKPYTLTGIVKDALKEIIARENT